MDFLNDVRVYVDDNTKMALESFKYNITNLVIEEWIVEQENLYDRGRSGLGDLNSGNYCDLDSIEVDVESETCSYGIRLKLFIRCDLWERFKNICRRKGIGIDVGFKMAVDRFNCR